MTDTYNNFPMHPKRLHLHAVRGRARLPDMIFRQSGPEGEHPLLGPTAAPTMLLSDWRGSPPITARSTSSNPDTEPFI
ncbi:hypothetical protein NDU88_005199 [Pleurodeles waltl]|uniref:Uncharacterized protein n=1 Tax=Pleurodeles waltl TaxID=8319 RepID=A0AAV7UL77_PLEWA|nr:hypothetical protein NDU88_005199 [Pleurodeles waltl]